MFTNATVFTCPFCPEPEGQIYIDTEACLDQRGEDSDPVYLGDGALDDGQDMIRFGRRTDRRTPCRHLVFARGTVEWYGRGWEEDGPQWGIEFEWTPRSFKKVDRGIGAIVLGDPEQLAELGATLKPRVRVVFDRPAFSWDALECLRSTASIYRVDAVFVAAARPLALRAAVKARVKEIRAFGKKLRLGGGPGGDD